MSKDCWTPEQWREYNHNYHLAHREEIHARKKAMTPEQREAKKAYDKVYHHANVEKRRAAANAWAKAHPERIKELAARYKQKPEIRARIRANNQRQKALRRGVPTLKMTPALLAGKLAYWGGLCWICRVAPHEEWDHVKPVSKGGSHMLANLRPSCHSCNIKKSAEWPFEVAA